MSQGRIVWIASFPSSGNTWTRTFLTALLHTYPWEPHINALGSVPNAASRKLVDRVSGLDSADLLPHEVLELRARVYRKLGMGAGGPGFLKIHDRLERTPAGSPLIPPEATRGVVYLIRNPLDVIGSFAGHFGLQVEEAARRLSDDDHTLGGAGRGAHSQLPQRLGSWSAHVESWLGQGGLRTMVVRYEDLLADPRKAFGAMARFVDLPHHEIAISQAVEASRFARLRKQEEEEGFRERSPQGQRFFRRGRAGGWRTELTPSQVEQVVSRHGAVMREHGYLDAAGHPV